MELSITRALAELKLLDKKIEKAIGQAKFTAIAIGKKPVKGYTSIEEFEKDVKSQYQSVMDLMKRRQDIKSAVVKSNATTEVTIAGKVMTVAEAIEMKVFIGYKQNLLHKLMVEFNRANDQAEIENQNVKVRLDKMLEASFQKDSKTKDTEIENISKPYLEANEARVVDPLNARKKIEELQEEIDNFLAEVDFVLSESNTITKITIED